MSRPKRIGLRHFLIFNALAILLLITSCSVPTPTATPIAVPTPLLLPTATVAPVRSAPTSVPTVAAVAPTQAIQSLVPVTEVVDGDTIKVSMGGRTETIRIIGIDTPEVVDPTEPVQCFGRETSAKATSTTAKTSLVKRKRKQCSGLIPAIRTDWMGEARTVLPVKVIHHHMIERLCQGGRSVRVIGLEV